MSTAVCIHFSSKQDDGILFMLYPSFLFFHLFLQAPQEIVSLRLMYIQMKH
jgi:hypothetical protein